VGSRKGFICGGCSDDGKKYRADEDMTIRQQAIDTIEARVADYSTHEDVSPYWGGGIVNPNKYLYFKLRYSWDNHPKDREEIIQQYNRGIKDGSIDPSNPLPHGEPNQHLMSQWDAESFSAKDCDHDKYNVISASEIVGGRRMSVVCVMCDTKGVGEYQYVSSPLDERPHDLTLKEVLDVKWLAAESFSAESDELEESKKRTKMSAIRTGLAITTFGIVMWNLWTNKKQEKDIADIMDLV
jgi:hypothetical protein